MAARAERARIALQYAGATRSTPGGVPGGDGRAPHLVDRIQAATRLGEAEIAKALGCTAQALRKLKGKDRGQLVAVNRDPLWAQLDAFVAEQIGAMLAIREELAAKLETDRRRQLLERMRVERRQ